MTERSGWNQSFPMTRGWNPTVNRERQRRGSLPAPVARTRPGRRSNGIDDPMTRRSCRCLLPTSGDVFGNQAIKKASHRSTRLCPVLNAGDGCLIDAKFLGQPLLAPSLGFTKGFDVLSHAANYALRIIPRQCPMHIFFLHSA